MRCLHVFVASVLLMASVGFADVDPVSFDPGSGLDKRYEALTKVLRCPKCQNQNIAGSDAPIAVDMRRKVEQQLKAGKTDREIETFMVERYGDYVTYDPPVKQRTLFLWLGPLLFFGVMVLVVWFSLLRKPSAESGPGDTGGVE